MMFTIFFFFVLNQDLMFLSSFAQTDAQVAGVSAGDTNGDLQKFVIAKQWKKVEEANFIKVLKKS